MLFKVGMKISSNSRYIYIYIYMISYTLYFYSWLSGWLGAMSTSVSLFISPLVIGLCRRKSTRLTAVMGGLITALGCLFTSFASQFHQLFFSYGMMIGKICIWIISSLFSRLSVVFLFVYKTDVTFFVDMLNSKLNALATYSISEVNYYFSYICDSILF